MNQRTNPLLHAIFVVEENLSLLAKPGPALRCTEPSEVGLPRSRNLAFGPDALVEVSGSGCPGLPLSPNSNSLISGRHTDCVLELLKVCFSQKTGPLNEPFGVFRIRMEFVGETDRTSEL